MVNFDPVAINLAIDHLFFEYIDAVSYQLLAYKSVPSDMVKG